MSAEMFLSKLRAHHAYQVEPRQGKIPEIYEFCDEYAPTMQARDGGGVLVGKIDLRVGQPYKQLENGKVRRILLHGLRKEDGGDGMHQEDENKV